MSMGTPLPTHSKHLFSPPTWPFMGKAQRHCPDILGFWVWFPARSVLECPAFLNCPYPVRSSLNTGHLDLKFSTRS